MFDTHRLTLAPPAALPSFWGSGAEGLGGITGGGEAAFGASAGGARDVPERGVVGGIPAKLLSDQGSHGYINRLAPPELLAAYDGALHGWLETRTAISARRIREPSPFVSHDIETSIDLALC